MTLIPNLADEAEHVTMLQRSPTYIVALPAKNPLVRLLRKVLPDSLVRSGRSLAQRAAHPRLVQLQSSGGPKIMKWLLRKGVELRLPKDYDIDTHFTPQYDPWDQRLCLVPNGDLFKSISAGDASVVTDHIETFTETGIALESGRDLDADIVVTATGLELLFIGGIEASIDGEPTRPAQQADVQGHDAGGRARTSPWPSATRTHRGR